MFASWITKTDGIRHYVLTDGVRVSVPNRDAGLGVVRRAVENGSAAMLITEQAYFCRRATALMKDGNWKYTYRLEWHEYTPRLDMVG